MVVGTSHTSKHFMTGRPSLSDLTEPAEIRHLFERELIAKHARYADQLTCLFYGIAGPESFYQLRAACNAVRANHQSSASSAAKPHVQDCQFFGQINGEEALSRILHRHRLLALAVRKEERQTHHLEVLSSPTFRRLKYGDEKQIERKPSSSIRTAMLAIADLVAEENANMPQTEQGLMSRARIHRRLTQARNWKALTQAFTLGIVAVVPCGSDIAMFDSDIEDWPKEVCAVLIDALQCYRGQFLLGVGNMLSKHIFEILVKRDFTFCFVLERIQSSISLAVEADSFGWVMACCYERTEERQHVDE